MAAILVGEVAAGITAIKGKPSKRAKEASEIAVLPEEASTMVVLAVIQPLHGLDHGVGHPVLSVLFYPSLWWTDGRWW
jgi:hypothetical protein